MKDEDIIKEFNRKWNVDLWEYMMVEIGNHFIKIGRNERRKNTKCQRS